MNRLQLTSFRFFTEKFTQQREKREKREKLRTLHLAQSNKSLFAVRCEALCIKKRKKKVYFLIEFWNSPDKTPPSSGMRGGHTLAAEMAESGPLIFPWWQQINIKLIFPSKKPRQW